MKKALLLLLLIIIPFLSFSQGRWINHKSQDALPSTNVRDVLVDSKGNKWFATNNGLAKFDGTNWTVFKAAYLQLKNNDIYALEEDLQGRIWVATAQDVEVYDGENWTYYNQNNGLLSNKQQAIKADGHGNVWLVSNVGITRFNGKTFESISQLNGKEIKNVSDVEIDQVGDPWFSYLDAQTNRASIVMYKGGVWTFFGYENFGEETFSPLKLSFADGKIWAGAYQRLFYFGNGSFHRFEMPKNINNPEFGGEVVEVSKGVLWFTCKSSTGFFKSTDFIKYDGFYWDLLNLNLPSSITSMKADGAFVWCGSEQGVSKIDIASNKRQIITQRAELSTNKIANISILNSGTPWAIGLADNGISIDKREDGYWNQDMSSNIGHNGYVESINNVFQDIHGKFWVVTISDVHMLDQGKWTRFNDQNSLITNNSHIQASATDKKGNTYIKFYSYPLQQYKLIMYDGTRWHDITKSHPSLESIYKIIPTSDGKIWFFNDNGATIKDENSWATQNLSLSFGFSSAIPDKSGGIWFGSSNSRIYHHASGVTKEYNLSQLLGGPDSTNVRYSIRSLTIDNKGHVWAGGHADDSYYGRRNEAHPGLTRFDGTNWTAYSKANGLISDAVNTVASGVDGTIWIGTQNGISQLIPFSETTTINKTNITCHGGNDGSIIVTPEGLTPPYQYSIDGGKFYRSDNAFNGLAAGSYHVIVKDGKGLTAHDEVIALTQPGGVFTWKVTPVSCAGAQDGAITLTIQNDGTPIRFQWYKDGVPVSNGNTQNISALSGGTYKVVASYGECTVTKVIEVPEPQPLQATIDYLNSCGNSFSGQIDIRTTKGGTAPYKYSIDGGAAFQTQKVFTGLAVGTYQVLVQDSKGCTFTTSQVTIELKDKPEPVITFTGSLSLCTGSSTLLKTSQSYDRYEWYDDKGSLLSTNESLEVKQAGTFHVVVYKDQCQATSKTVTTTMVTPYNQQQICIVTVDAATGKNKIVWTKAEGRNIASYKIYKETGTNQYSLIGSVAFDSDNFFIDRESDPMKASERYTISVVDICGNESTRSPAHKTIYLQASLGVNNKVNLNWDNYEGFTYTQVNILRGDSTNSLKLLETRPANSNSFTDTNPNPTQIIYVIEAVTNYSCDGNAGGSAKENLKVVQQNGNAFTRSNPSAARSPLGVKENIDSDTRLVVYPNPASSNITIELKEGAIIHSIRLLDISGREVQSSLVRNGKSSTVLECKAKAGFYILEVKDTKNTTYRKRVILQ